MPSAPKGGPARSTQLPLSTGGTCATQRASGNGNKGTALGQGAARVRGTVHPRSKEQPGRVRVRGRSDEHVWAQQRLTVRLLRHAARRVTARPLMATRRGAVATDAPPAPARGGAWAGARQGAREESESARLQFRPTRFRPACRGATLT